MVPSVNDLWDGFPLGRAVPALGWLTSPIDGGLVLQEATLVKTVYNSQLAFSSEGSRFESLYVPRTIWGCPNLHS